MCCERLFQNWYAVQLLQSTTVSFEPVRHIDIQHFSIEHWADAKEIVMQHIPGILSISDGLKALCWVLHSRRMMGQIINSISVVPLSFL